MKAVKKGNHVKNAGPVETRVNMMEAQMSLWAVQIDGMANRVEAAGDQARIDYRQSMDDLKVKRAAVREKLDELKVAGIDHWETFKSDIDDAWKDLEVAFKDLKV